MIKHFIAIIILSLAINACGQTNRFQIAGLTIDPAIKKEAEEYVSGSEIDSLPNGILVYSNTIMADLYEDDKLIMPTYDKNSKLPFKSFYYQQKDTLGIEGAYGLFGGAGFSIKIVNGKATLYHMLASDDFPTYAYKEGDSLIFRLEVPCTDTKIVLSEMPDTARRNIIYGYVEFKSGEYYQSSGSADEHEILPRKKERVNMRIYFKSGLLSL